MCHYVHRSETGRRVRLSENVCRTEFSNNTCILINAHSPYSSESHGNG